MSELWLAVTCTLLGLVVGSLSFGGMLYSVGRRDGLKFGYRNGFRDGLRHAASREFADEWAQFRKAMIP